MGHHHEAHAKTKIALLASPLVSQQKVSSEASSTPSEHYDSLNHDPESSRPHQINDEELHEMPEFQRHEEATTIELFYDLFFVANLTTFTSIHEINESHALTSYAGFFCILWFTWCQVGLFDVRFITDSVLERIAKACQFGVMVGFAVVGPNFDPASQKQSTFRALSIILAISRFVLSLQYLSVMWHIKNYKKSKTPLTIIAISNFVAGIIYLAIAFTFKKKGNSSSYIAWYVVAVLETCINIAVSSKWKVVSFKGTHLVQRMSLLTLIILGEGIIVICKSISKIVKNQNAWSTDTIGTVTAAVTIIYLLYMLYFDWLSPTHFGSIRQQIWAFLHFPFHLSLVLFMEGTAQLIIWQKLVDVIQIVLGNFHASESQDVDGDKSDLVIALNATIQDFIATYPPTYVTTYYDFDDILSKIGNATSDGLLELYGRLDSVLFNSLFTTYGIVPPKDKNADSSDANTDFEKQIGVIDLVFIYFFITAGTTLLLMNLLNYLSLSHKTSGKMSKRTIVRLAFTTLVGVVLCVLPVISLSDTAIDFFFSAWIIPTVTFALLFVLVAAHVKSDVGKKHKEEH